MNIKERISTITEYWFLTEPLLFAALCTHEVVENNNLSIPFRTGKRRIEFNSELLCSFSDSDLSEYLKIEIIRILLKHPYQRLPPFPNRRVLTYASNITIADCYPTNCELAGVNRWPLPKNLCFEEYYDMVFAILSTPPEEGCNSGEESIIPPENPKDNSYDEESDTSVEQVSELWEENEETYCDINNLIEMAEISCTWGSLSGKLQSTIRASMKIEMDYRKILSLHLWEAKTNLQLTY